MWCGWRIDVSADARLNAHEDAFGNITHVFAADGPFAELSLKVDGEVETQNTDGVVHGTVERFPSSLFLRDTPLTHADADICDFALDIRAVNSGDRLAELHALAHRLHDETICEQDSAPATTAAEAFARKRGATRDLTHIFLGAARSLQSRPVMSRDTCAPTTAALTKAVMPGPRPTCPVSAGSASMR